MKTVAIVQARMASSRLPGKILADIEGKPMLLRVWDRVRRIQGLDEAVIATTVLPSDDAVEEFCSRHDIPCFRGSAEDVLDRFYRAAQKFEADSILRLTGDCPLMDPQIHSDLLREFQKESCDFASNVLQPTLPDGLDGEAFRFQALETAAKEAVKKSDREHVAPFIYQHPERFHLHSITNETDFSYYRWTVDEPGDLELARAVYRHFGERIFDWKEVLALLAENPKLAALNKGIPRNEGYVQSLRHD